MKKTTILILTAVAATTMVCTTALTSCSGKQETATAADGTTIELPSDIHYYTAGERKAGKKPTSEVLGFRLVPKNMKDGKMDVKEHEFEGNTHIREIYMTDPCTNIAPYAFAGCTNLQQLVSTATIDVINDNAFEGCSSLGALESDVRTIGLSSFAGCTSMERFIATDNLYWVRDSAFLNCTSLKSVIMGIALSKFEDTAFEGCTAVEEISIPSAWKLHMFNVYKSMPNIQRVYLLTMEPFGFPESSKDFPCEQVDLYVPDAFLQNFKEDASWARFKSIVPLSQSQYFTETGIRK